MLVKGTTDAQWLEHRQHRTASSELSTVTEEEVTVIVKIKRVTNCQGEATWIAVN